MFLNKKNEEKARSFSTAKVLSSLVVDGFSKIITRRGYAATSRRVVSSSVARARATASSRRVAKKAGEDGASEKVAWVPDAITGYYRPENGAQEIDVAELRAMLLKKN